MLCQRCYAEVHGVYSFLITMSLLYPFNNCLIIRHSDASGSEYWKYNIEMIYCKDRSSSFTRWLCHDAREHTVARAWMTSPDPG